MKTQNEMIDNMYLSITTLEETDGKYGHTTESVAKYREYLELVKSFFRDKRIKPKYADIVGIHVSNSGCNVSLMIRQPDHSGIPGRQNDILIHHHRIYTTQNEHLIRFGFLPVRTDLYRFIQE